jgi:predicted ArsR family transcriptional regulator
MSTKSTIKRPARLKTSKPEEPLSAKKAALLTTKGPSKQAQLIELLQGDKAASTTDLASALGWLPHTTRAALTGLRKKGHAVVSEKVDGETRYRIERGA